MSEAAANCSIFAVSNADIATGLRIFLRHNQAAIFKVLNLVSTHVPAHLTAIWHSLGTIANELLHGDSHRLMSMATLVCKKVMINLQKSAHALVDVAAMVFALMQLPFLLAQNVFCLILEAVARAWNGDFGDIQAIGVVVLFWGTIGHAIFLLHHSSATAHAKRE